MGRHGGISAPPLNKGGHGRIDGDKFLDTSFGINYPLIIHLPSIETFAMPTKKNAKFKNSKNVVSAFVFDKEEADHIDSKIKNNVETVAQPITASVFIREESDLTFKTRLRNLIQYTVDCLHDNLADQTPITTVLKRSVQEMKALSDETAKRLSAETAKRYNELIEEITAFMVEDKTEEFNNEDLKSVLHYRHYVRIAWLSHFILEDLKNSSK